MPNLKLQKYIKYFKDGEELGKHMIHVVIILLDIIFNIPPIFLP